MTCSLGQCYFKNSLEFERIAVHNMCVTHVRKGCKAHERGCASQINKNFLERESDANELHMDYGVEFVEKLGLRDRFHYPAVK